MSGRAGGAAALNGPDASARRVAELEAENAALRRALASGSGPAPRRALSGGGRCWRLLEAAPNPYLVLRPDAPRFTIAAASDAYLRATMTRREELAGRGVFEALTDDPARPDATGARNLRASLERVLASRAPDRMPVQRYDVQRPDGSFEERHWSPLNAPVIGPDGEVEAVVHHVEDVTEAMRADEALLARERRLRILVETASGLLAAPAPDEVLAPVFRALSGEFGVDISFSFVADGGGLRLASCFGLPEGGRAGFARLALGQAVCGIAARDRRVVEVADAQASDDPAVAIIRGLGVRAYVAFPLVADGARLLGTMSFGSRARAGFSGDDLSFFGAIAHNVAVARERKRAEERLREVEARQGFLLRLGDALRPLRNATEMQATACRLLGAHLRAAQVGFGEVDDAQERVAVHRDWNDGRVPSVVGTWRMDDFGPAMVAAMKRGETAAIPDIREDPRTGAPAVATAYAGIGARAILDVPLVKGGRMAAMLFVHHPEPRPWSAADVEVVEETCGRLWDAVERTHAEAALRRGEARWRGLFGSMQEGFALCEMVYDAEGRAVDYRHLELNAAWGRLTGVPNEAVQGKLVSEAIPGIEPFWLETYARVVETGEPAHFEYHLAAFGRWFEVMAYRTEPGRFAAVFLNVTERKRADARRDALVELGDRLRDLRDPGEIARAAAEVIGRALGAARAGCGTVDAAQETLSVERDWTCGPLGSVAGEHRLPEYWTGFADDLRRGEVVAVGDAARDPRTAVHAASYAALGVRSFVHVPVVERGRVAALLFVHDVAPRAWTGEEVAFVRGAADRAWAAAERARAEAALRDGERRLQATQDHAGVGINEIDAGGRYVRVNETYARLSGWTAADLSGRAYWDLIEDEGDRREARRDFGRLVRGEADRLRAEREYTDRHGRRWWAEVTATAIRGEPDAEHPEGRFLYAVRVVQDITGRKRAEERRALLVNELNHRVKNTLAVVQSIALQTARGAADLPAFAAAFQARLIALARAHDLLTREDWRGAPLGAVVRGALGPVDPARAEVDLGACPPGALLPPAQALALSMALHELATNALKHGALSAPGGRVAVACSVDPGDGAHVLEWAERGGPPIAGPPPRKGFGLRLLERGLAAQAGVAADLRFEPDGLRCTLRLPPPPVGARAEGA